MSLSPSVICNHPYYDSSSSSSSSSSSRLNWDIPQENFILLNDPSSQKEKKSPVCRYQQTTKRSRIKKRMNDVMLESKLKQLSNENEILRAKINMLSKKFGHLTSENDEQFEFNELTTIQQPTVLNILDQSSTQINHSNQDLSLTTKKEQLSLEKSSIPIKLRLKLLDIKSDL